MRVIINNKRYGALRTFSDRKQAFNEYLDQKKKLEAEERHNDCLKNKEIIKTSVGRKAYRFLRRAQNTNQLEKEKRGKRENLKKPRRRKKKRGKKRERNKRRQRKSLKRMDQIVKAGIG